jgi:DNA mismatch repair protein MutS2
MQSLCAFALSQPGLINASMAFDPVLLQPSYRFRQGIPGRSHALEIASQSGLQPDLLERSRALVGGQHLELSSIIASLQERFAELEKERAELKRQQRRLQRKTAAAAEEERTLAAARKDVQNQTRTKVRAEVERAEARLRDLLQGVRSRHLRQEVAAELAEVKAELLPAAAPEVVQLEAPASGLPPEAWNKGDLVLHLSLRKSGTLLRIDRKTVQIDLGGLQLLARHDEVLHLAAQAPPPHSQVISECGEQPPPTMLQLRLLGLPVDQALTELESSLDRALANQQPFLEIVHGKGSGALKTAVRQHLSSHPASSWWTVELDPQNDGITRLVFQ